VSKMNNYKDIEVALSHEFWCCQREFESFVHHAVLLFSMDNEKNVRIQAFTAYGNFIRHLYTFYEGMIKYRNANLLDGAKGQAIGKKISKLMNEEVKKLIRNKALVYNSSPELDSREMMNLVESEVPEQFGTDFRQMRNRFSHAATSRINRKEVTLSDFYNRYHRYMMLLYQTCSFTWNIEKVDQYDWLEIDNFLKVIKSNPI